MGKEKKYDAEQRREDERITEIVTRIKNDEDISDEEIVNSRVVSNRLKSTSLAYAPTPKALHSIIPFYSNVIVDMCPHCSRNINIEHFEEYLKHGLITPILGAPEEYNAELLDLCQQYPYLTTKSYLILKQKKLFEKYGESILCPHCNKELVLIQKSLERARQKYPEKRERIDYINSCLYPTFEFEMELLKYALDEKEFLKNCDEVFKLALRVFVLRNAQAIHATPIIDYSNFNYEILKSLPSVETDRVDLNNAIMQGLELDYRDDMPMGMYLDIIEKRRKNISYLTEKIVKRAGCSDRDVYSIKDICREINGEVAEFRASRKFKIMKTLSSFTKQNKATIASGIIGFGLGTCAGFNPFIGAGVGASLSALAKKGTEAVLEGAQEIKIPGQSEYMDGIFDYVTSPIVEKMFFNDLPVVHAYRLKTEIENAK